MRRHTRRNQILSFERNGRVHLNRRGASVQSTTGSRGVRISGSNAGYTMFRVSVKSTGYPIHSPVSPSLPLPCVTVCHHISTGLYRFELLLCGTAISDPILLRSDDVKTSDSYRRMITLRTKHRCFLSEESLVLHNNARSHFTAATVQAIRQLKFELFPHHSTGSILGRLNPFDTIWPRAHGGIRARAVFKNTQFWYHTQLSD